jgi:hypothetical protein
MKMLEEEGLQPDISIFLLVRGVIQWTLIEFKWRIPVQLGILS